jgi:hypothetical protein
MIINPLILIKNIKLRSWDKNIIFLKNRINIFSLKLGLKSLILFESIKLNFILLIWALT